MLIAHKPLFQGRLYGLHLKYDGIMPIPTLMDLDQLPGKKYDSVYT
jgi:hypothetical protein